MNVSKNLQPSAFEIEETYPMSPLQQGMLYHNLLAQNTGVDIAQLLCELHEFLDAAPFQRAWQHVAARHPVLRTSFRWEGLDEPLQEVHSQVKLPWEQHDLRGLAADERERRLANFLQTDRRRGFEMSRAPLQRLTLFQCDEADFRMVWTFHHSLMDDRSFALVLREAFGFYEAFRQGQDLVLPLPRPYRDYIGWLQAQDFSGSEAFWRQALKGFPAPTPLVMDRAASTGGEAGARQGDREIWLSTESTAALKSLAQMNQLTLECLMQGAWALLLSRYSSEEDVVFGAIRNCRPSSIDGVEAMVGLFWNTQPLRVHVDPEAALVPWLKELRRQWLALQPHEHTPLFKVQGWSEVPAGMSLFDSILDFEEFQLNTSLRAQGGSWSHRQFRFFGQPNYPLTLAVYAGSELCLKIEFNRNHFDAATVERMLGHLQILLQAMVACPHQRLRDLPLLTAAERQQLLVEWNATARDYPQGQCLHELFEAQVERTPASTAVAFEGERLTYNELNARSNQLAYCLRNLGVGPDVLVGLCVERSMEMVVGLLGILKAGGAYVPIDPGYPAERVAFMLEDAHAPVVLTQQSLARSLPTLPVTNIVCLDEPEWAAPNSGNPVRNVSDANLAYVIYTSGSTGKPKGAMIPHRAIVNHMGWMQEVFPLDERDAVFQKTPFSFDASVWEFYAPLCVGGRLVVARPGGHLDTAYLADTIMRQRITTLQLVPSLLRMLLETQTFKNCRSLRRVFCGGEPLSGDLVRKFCQTLPAELHNLYGPTEVTIDSVFYSVPRDKFADTVPIGRPVANTQAYVLNRHRQPVPIGVPGELYLGGVQVGCGYHNRPELTAERFLPDPFSTARDALLYKTGDKVRYRPDGNIEFLGRMDHQVKLRGFRIELGEIESTLGQHAAVKEAVAVVREDVPGDQRLVAYLLSKSGEPPKAAELRQLLKAKLPDYMVPSIFVFLDHFPMTPNGKLDRKALPPPEGRQSELADSCVAPHTSTEKTLAGIWCALLGLHQVGRHDNFFELGGHSLLATRLASRVHDAFAVQMSLGSLFENPTIFRLGEQIETLLWARTANNQTASASSAALVEGEL